MPENNFIYQDHFILADQQEVSHDTSLSGNGTVNSPLGVVPGYNETVLWSGDSVITATSAINTSEPYRNFERLQIYGRGVSDQVPRLYGECVCTQERYCPLMFTYPAGDNNTLRFASFHLDFSDSDNTKILLAKGKIWNLSNNSVSTGNYGGSITHVIGINRKQ